jgi:hypothetical protein
MTTPRIMKAVWRPLRGEFQHQRAGHLADLVGEHVEGEDRVPRVRLAVQPRDERDRGVDEPARILQQPLAGLHGVERFECAVLLAAPETGQVGRGLLAGVVADDVQRGFERVQEMLLDHGRLLQRHQVDGQPLGGEIGDQSTPPLQEGVGGGVFGDSGYGGHEVLQ